MVTLSYCCLLPAFPERERESAPICWFTLQLLVMAGAQSKFGAKNSIQFSQVAGGDPSYLCLPLGSSLAEGKNQALELGMQL